MAGDPWLAQTLNYGAEVRINAQAAARGPAFTGKAVSGLEKVSGGYRVRFTGCDIYTATVGTRAFEVHGSAVGASNIGALAASEQPGEPATVVAAAVRWLRTAGVPPRGPCDSARVSRSRLSVAHGRQMSRHLTLVVALAWGSMLALSLSWSARAQGPSQEGGAMTQLSGHWVSTEHVTFTNPSLAGSSFFLDIVIARDGTFQGVWDAYSCFSYPGAYGISIISCTRVQRPAKARGKFNAAARNGEIELDQLGRTTFAYSLGSKLLLELPKDWLKQGAPVLYTSELVRASKQ